MNTNEQGVEPGAVAVTPEPRTANPRPHESADLEGDEEGAQPTFAERARAFTREHPWVVFGGAVGFGAALGVGSRHLPDRLTPEGRIRDTAIGSAVGSALMRVALSMGLRKLSERL